MALTKEDVRHVAKLARITLSEKESELFYHQLQSIFEHLDKLSEVDTKGIPETSQVSGLHSAVRPDLVTPSLPREAVVQTSKRKNTRGMIQVKKSI